MRAKVNIQLLKPDVQLPSYGHPGDAGLDVRALEDYTLQPGQRKTFDLGFALEFAADYVAIIKDKSSLPKNGGIHVLGGVYDSSYRGEYNVMLINLGTEPYEIKAGHKIAQIVILPFITADMTQVETLSETSRGTGRFGSTGQS